MDISLTPVSLRKKPILIKLLEMYLFEMLGEKTAYKYLDSYWNKTDRYAFFIKKNNNIVGFVLINSYTVVGVGAKSIAEFYIKRKFRRAGIGKKAAFMALDLFPGKWEIREISQNKLGHLFWKKIISEYTNKEYVEKMFNNKKWSGPIQIFSTKSNLK